MGVRECAQFFNYFPSLPIVDSCSTPKLILGALQNILVKSKSLLNRTRFWDLLKHQHALLVIKQQLKKHGLEMSPELLQATCREPACPGESGCSWKAKGKQAKVEMYEDVLEATPVCPIRGCALCGELQLEAGGSTSSSGFVLAQRIKPARSAWEISVCSSTSQLASSCCFLGEKELLKPKQCTQPATAMRIKRNSQGNIS